VAAYVDSLLEEMELVAKAICKKLPVKHIHFGGGSPQILDPAAVDAIGSALHKYFELTPDVDIAIEVDPAQAKIEVLEAYLKLGVTRVSCGLQDLDPKVQEAINRPQSLEKTAQILSFFRERGVASINLDLMYGLPLQTPETMSETVEQVITLDPDRVALFGYAHVPWMKKHQRLLEKNPLPNSNERHALFCLAAEKLENAGYCSVGIDHFAKKTDSLSLAAKEKRLHRNFQGYTTDETTPLLGFGASAIGSLGEAYFQNVADIKEYQKLVANGNLPVSRGIILNEQDLLRRSIIEDLMCHFTTSKVMGAFDLERKALAPWIEEGLVRWDEEGLTIVKEPRLLARVVASAFDKYLQPCHKKHSLAV